MNNMNFRRQMNCQNYGNYNCQKQPQKTEPKCHCDSQMIEPRTEKPDCNRQMTMPCGDCKHDYHDNKPPTHAHDCDCHNVQKPPYENCDEAIAHIDMHNIPIGIGYVPWQKWRKIHALCEGLSQGTIFKELSLPFYGCIPNGFCNNKGGAK